MAQLTTSYQRIAQGTAKAFGSTTSRVDIYAKYNSQSIANNTTNYSVQLRLVKVSGGYIGEYTGTTVKLSSTGLTSYNASGGTGNFENKTLCTITGDVVHNSDGTKSVSASASMQFKAWGMTLTVSGSATLPTIPRYAAITSFSVSKRDETSVTYNFTTDATCDYAWYSKDNGATWSPLPANHIVTGLTANTTYNFKLRVRRTDSQLTTDSGTAQQTTYDYPFCTSSPNFVIGNQLTLSLYNPLSRNVTVSLIGADGTVMGSDTTTGTSITGYNNSAWKTWLYSTIPASKRGTYQVRVVYGSSTKTRNNGNYYDINESECFPTFSDFDYEDTNTNTIVLTGSNQILVDNYSICKFDIPTRATAKNSAYIDNYLCYYGNNYITYLEKNMSDYWKKTYASRFTISYDSVSDMNTISCAGAGGWECLYFPLTTVSGKTYELTFDYENPNGYTPLAGYSGIPCQIITRLDDSDNVSNQITATTLDPTASPDTQHLEVSFTANSNITYINFNFGCAADNTTSTIYLGNFKLNDISGTGNTLKITANDSRTLPATVTKTITNVPYKNAFINSVSTQRKNGVENETHLAGKITISNVSWDGTDAANSQNRLKYVGYSVYKNNAWSTYYDITSAVLTVATVTTDGINKIYEFTYADEIQIHENGSSGGFTIGDEFPIKVLIKDGNSSTIFETDGYQAIGNTEVSDGTVATCLHKDTNGKYHLGINCMSDNDYMIVANDNPIVDNSGNVIINAQSIVNVVYPVGSIYMSVNSTSPATLFGGTWEQIKDRFLLSAGNTYTAGATGGEATHTLTINEMPSHNHNSRSLTGYFTSRRYGTSGVTDIAGIETSGIVSREIPTWSGSHSIINAGSRSVTNPAWDKVNINATHTHDSQGGGQAHNNMPPYLVVYMWKRTA